MDFNLFIFIVSLCFLFSEHECQRPIGSLRSQKSQDLNRYMNLSVDPCEDFYEYACGNFKTVFPSKNENVYPVSVLQQLEDRVDQELLKLLIQPLNIKQNIIHQHLKDFYTSCTNVEQIRRVGNEPIKSVIKSLGGETCLFLFLLFLMISIVQECLYWTSTGMNKLSIGLTRSAS